MDIECKGREGRGAVWKLQLKDGIIYIWNLGMIRSELPIPSNFQNVEISVVMIVLPASSQIICNTHFTLLPINWCAGKIITQIKYDIMTWFLIWIFFLSKLESHWWVFLHPFNFLFLPSFLDPHTSYGISKKERGKKIILPSGAAALEIISGTILLLGMIPPQRLDLMIFLFKFLATF